MVIITPMVSLVVDKAKLGWKDAPQTWLAAALCLMGVASLELGGDGGLGDIGMGDFWSVMQAVGFGVGFFFTEVSVCSFVRSFVVLVAICCYLLLCWYILLFFYILLNPNNFINYSTLPNETHCHTYTL